jgi:thymidylate synthase
MDLINSRIHIENVQTDYVKLLTTLRDQGVASSPRGQATREVMDVVMKLDPHYAIVTGINRKLSMKLISMEALQLISRTSYPERTVRAMPNMASFMDGGSFHGAYGTRIGSQLGHAIEKLKNDSDTRQAVMTIWNPQFDNGMVVRDTPCTSMLQFFIRDNRLVLHVTMRSNDAWWGTPHDWGQFSQLQLAVAKILEIEAGPYYHHVVSFHLYERDIEKIETLMTPSADLRRFDGIGVMGNALDDVTQIAKRLLDEPSTVECRSADEEWHKSIQLKINEAL